jgi:hypothetical protein
VELLLLLHTIPFLDSRGIPLVLFCKDVVLCFSIIVPFAA